MNLCDTCCFNFATCNAGVTASFGTGKGNDNVVTCSTHKTVRKLKEFDVVEGTDWIPTHDEFGTSFKCSVCGHHAFYEDKIPTPCTHEHQK